MPPRPGTMPDDFVELRLADCFAAGVSCAIAGCLDSPGADHAHAISLGRRVAFDSSRCVRQGTGSAKTRLSRRRAATLKRVFAAWNARQAKIQGVSCHVGNPESVCRRDTHCREVEASRNLQRMRCSSRTRTASVEVTLPQSEWWGEGRGPAAKRLQRVRLQRRSAGGKRRRSFCIVADGSRNLRLRVPVASANRRRSPSGGGYRSKTRPTGAAAGDLLLIVREVDLRPLRSRGPAARRRRVVTENCRVVSENAVVDGARCIETQMDAINHSERCWVDPARDDSVVRWERRQSDCPAWKSRSTFSAAAIANGFRRDGRGVSAGDGGGPPASFEARVTNCTILNQKLPEGTFSPAGPPGTRRL